jgi:hypothetical protein
MENYHDIPEHLKFPRTINHGAWKLYLGRDLLFEERMIMESYRTEKHINDLMRKLYKQCENKNLYVPCLTDMDGNCMFQSLGYLKIGHDVQKLRLTLAIMMYIFKDYSSFLPGTVGTLQEIFNNTNDIACVISRNKYQDEQVYKYTYTAMCQDLTNDHSWSRLPSHLILTVISYVFKLEIIIINNNNTYEMNINAYKDCPEKPELKKIYLGNIGESHYVPLALLEEDEEIDPIFYTDAKKRLLEWTEAMQQNKVNEYYESINNRKKDDEMEDMMEMKELNQMNKQEENNFVDMKINNEELKECPLGFNTVYF